MTATTTTTTTTPHDCCLSLTSTGRAARRRFSEESPFAITASARPIICISCFTKHRPFLKQVLPDFSHAPRPKHRTQAPSEDGEADEEDRKEGGSGGSGGAVEAAPQAQATVPACHGPCGAAECPRQGCSGKGPVASTLSRLMSLLSPAARTRGGLWDGADRARPRVCPARKRGSFHVTR